MRYLNRHVITHIAPVWYDVGLELFEAKQDDEMQLEGIKAETGLSDRERATTMLKLWLQKNPDASWNDLLEALKSSSVGLQSTARTIEEMLLSESMQ